jgi:hypothetical protein
MRDWWLRTLLVLQRPRPVFVALRDDSKESMSDRAEPVLLVILLAGIAGVLSTRSAGQLMDDGDYDNLLVAVWAFLAGGVYGIFGYFVFAATPIALSLVLWPIKLAVYGDALFRSGGSDHTPGMRVFDALELAFLLWAAALLVIGVRAVHGWTWSRAAAACTLAVVVPTLVGIALAL